MLFIIYIMNKISIKPLSVNQAWQGKRFKTNAYKQYERDVLLLLPKAIIPKGAMEIHLEFGFSNKASDIDNPIKSILDILQKKYQFNDSRVYKLVVTKTIVVKKEEFFKFKIIEA